MKNKTCCKPTFVGAKLVIFLKCGALIFKEELFFIKCTFIKVKVVVRTVLGIEVSEQLDAMIHDNIDENIL